MNVTTNINGIIMYALSIISTYANSELSRIGGAVLRVG